MAYHTIVQSRLSYFDFEKSMQKAFRIKMEEVSKDIRCKLNEEYCAELEELRIKFEETMKDLEVEYLEQMTEKTRDSVKDAYRAELERVRIEFEENAKELQPKYVKKMDEAICIECTDLLMELARELHMYVEENLAANKTSIQIRLG